MTILGAIIYWMLSILVSHCWGWPENNPTIREPETCLLGYMTEWQSWVDKEGELTNETIAATIDVSSMHYPTLELQKKMSNMNANDRVKTLSLAKCGLRNVPKVFHLQDGQGRCLSDTLQFVTFYGNRFNGYFNWTSGLKGIVFNSLRELDIRNCSIKSLGSNTFEGMQKLEALYLGENNILEIAANAFYGLKSLKHLDLSSNTNVRYDERMVIVQDAFTGLKNLEFLDLSLTRLDRKCLQALDDLGSRLKVLSLCQTALKQLAPAIFNNTSIAYLDISGNSGILDDIKTLRGLENSLQVLFACGVNLKSLKILYGFKKLEVLRLYENELTSISPETTSTLKSLKVLDLDRNRIQTWVQPVLGNMPLKILSLRENNLNLMSEAMMKCFYNLSYLAISGNNIVCNCNARELVEIALRNERKAVEQYLESTFSTEEYNPYAHIGFEKYNEMISKRRQTSKNCENKLTCSVNYRELIFNGKYLLLDHDVEAYKCLSSKGETETFLDSPICKYGPRNLDYEDLLNQGWAELWALILIPIIVFPFLIFLFVYRKNLRYFCVLVKNTATLSLMGSNRFADDGTIYHYDLFVSYCNDDRDWVLDHLLPHLEQRCNVRVCLHERDFQVGLSILENIVSCMDSSCSIMLVLSRKFLHSQWCQFEMHLAQHRLLETRREDLILILLEEIPRRLRPTTLHYLMLTKTYVVWPVDAADQKTFWRRLRRSLLARRLAHTDNVSLA